MTIMKDIELHVGKTGDWAIHEPDMTKFDIDEDAVLLASSVPHNKISGIVYYHMYFGPDFMDTFTSYPFTYSDYSS